MNSKISEAQISENKIYLNGWFRTVSAFLLAMLVSIGGWFALRVEAQNLEQEKRLTQIEIAIAKMSSLEVKLNSLDDDFDEIKKLLRRSIPKDQ